MGEHTFAKRAKKGETPFPCFPISISLPVRHWEPEKEGGGNGGEGKGWEKWANECWQRILPEGLRDVEEGKNLKWKEAGTFVVSDFL